MYNHNVKEVIPETLDLNFECKYALMTGSGIRMTATEPFAKVKKSDFNIKSNPKNMSKEKPKMQAVWNGVQSPFFGTDFKDDIEYAEKYSCTCGRYVGEMHKGTVCEYCGTKVEYIEADIKKTGWIINDHFSTISPIYVAKLQTALGKVAGEYTLTRILQTEFRTEPIFSEKEAKEYAANPFMKKGMVWFEEHFDEVMDYYIKKKPDKKKLLNELKTNKTHVFTKCIPVISAILRTEVPGEKGSKSYRLKINTTYKSLIKTSNAINKFGPVDQIDSEDMININRLLFQMYKEVSILFDEIFDTLNGKKGFILGKVVAGRLNFSARNVIIQQQRLLRTDEVELNYSTFMELYRYELLNQYMKITNCTVMEAHDAWTAAKINFDPLFYGIMEYMCNEHGDKLWILINRNPSINIGSFMCVRIAHVKRDIRDKTMTMNSSILTIPNADYDGDMFNIYRIFGMDLAKRFGETMNPRYNYAISRVDGRVNKDLQLIKDELIGFWTFNNI